MDPNANLNEQRQIARRIADDAYLGIHDTQRGLDKARLADLVLELDEWLRKGGALPTVWSNR